MKIRQLLQEGGLAQAFQKGLQNPVGTAKELATKTFTGTPSKSSATSSSPYDSIPSKAMKGIISKVLNKKELDPHEIKILQDLDRRL